MLLLCGYLLHKNRCSSHGFSSESRAIRTVRLYVSHLQRTRCIYHNVLWWSHCSHIYLFKNCSSLSLSLSLSLIFYFICLFFHRPVRKHSAHMRKAKGYNIKALSTFCFWAGRELYHVTSVMSRTLSFCGFIRREADIKTTSKGYWEPLLCRIFYFWLILKKVDTLLSEAFHPCSMPPPPPHH